MMMGSDSVRRVLQGRQTLAGRQLPKHERRKG